MLRKAQMDILYWDDIKNQVAEANQPFASIVNEISPGKDFRLYKVTYPFGSEVLQNGIFCLPNKHGQLVPIESSEIDKQIRDDLSYNNGSNPATFVLSNSLELFMELEDRIIPYSIITKGKIFGLWKLLDHGISHCPRTFVWGLTSGARSILMLPKISDNEGHARLRTEFHVTTDKPRNLLDQWQIFREIANSPVQTNPWCCKLLFFSKKWLENQNNNAWLKLNYYLLNSAWQSSAYWRNQYIWDLIFSFIQKKRNIKPPAFLSALVKHLFAAGVGAVPGFQAATDNSLAPIKQIQNAYSNIYGLKQYAPIIMQPSMFNMYDVNCHPVYCSLQFPTAIEFAQKSSDKTSILTDLYYAHSLLNKYYEEIGSGYYKVEDTPLNDLIKKINYKSFHSNPGNYRDIETTEKIFLEDSLFQKADLIKSNKIKFPKNSQFLTGCFRISHNSIDSKE